MNRYQRGDRQTLLLRNARRTAHASCQLRHRIQLRPPPEDAQRPHTPRVHLQALDERAPRIHTRSAPPDTGTQHAQERARPEGREAARQRPAWTLENDDLRRRPSPHGLNGAFCTRRTDQRALVPSLCRSGSRSDATQRRHRRHGQSRQPQGRWRAQSAGLLDKREDQVLI
jgi:hypothetical protein